MKTLVTLLFSFGFVCAYSQVSVKSFGAVGDGIKDDGPAIQAALTSGNSTISFEAGKLYITSVVLTVPSNVTVVGNGATLKPNSSFSTSAYPVITTSNKVYYYQAGTRITVKKGATTFTYANASALKVGYLVWLEGPQYITYSDQFYKYGWYATVAAISGTTVTLNVPAADTYTATSLTQYITTGNVQIKGLNVNLKGRKTGFGVGITNAVNSSISGCFVESDATSTCSEVGIYATGINLTVYDNKVRNMRVSNTGAGYGINVSGHNIVIRHNDVAIARHCITSAERYYKSSNIKIVSNTVDCGPGSAPIDFHGNTSGKIDSNTIYSNTPNIAGVMVRNSSTIVSNNTITMTNTSGTRVYGVGLSENGYNDITVIKNKVYVKGTAGGAGGVGIFSVSDTVNNLRVAQNYFQGYVSFTANLGVNIHIDSNTFEGNNIYNVYVSLNASPVKDYYIQGNTFLNNWDSRFNYTISTTTCATSTGTIRNNIIRCSNLANTAIQLRLNNQHNIVENNQFYCQSKTPLVDFTSNLQNWLNNNKKTMATTSTATQTLSANNTTLITYTTLPAATAWFYGRSILYTDAIGVTTQYNCIKTGTTSYAWQKQTNMAL